MTHVYVLGSFLFNVAAQYTSGDGDLLLKLLMVLAEVCLIITVASTSGGV